MPKLNFPEGKQFAFTIFDDTDFATTENVKPVYDFLSECGFRTTKSVWPIKGNKTPLCGGATCEDEDYRSWLLQLKQDGFEIGYHMATYHSSIRSETESGLKRFKEIFGQTPKIMANHSGCEENIYWGDSRLSGINKLFYNLATRYKLEGKYKGQVENDSHFWGDLCKKNITYCRNFVFDEINTLKVCPLMPYHDPDRPYVNYWYASSEGHDAASFIDRISETNQDRLEQEGGVCIMYTHFACGFYENGELNKEFKRLVKRLSEKNGWFVPAGQVLDFLKEQNGGYQITQRERNRLERRWLLDKLKLGHT